MDYRSIKKLFYKKQVALIDIDEHITIPAAKKQSPLNAEAVYELVLTRIRLLARRRVAWLRKNWTALTANSTEPFDAHTEIDGYLYDLDIPSLEKEWMAMDPQAQELTLALHKTEMHLGNDAGSRLAALAKIFGLNQVETDIIHCCLAISIDPNLGRVFAYLQDNAARAYVTETLVARLFGHGHSLLLDAGSPLKTWALVKESLVAAGEPLRLECDPFIKNWLLGANGIDEALGNFASVQAVKQPLQNWPVKKAVDFIHQLLKNDRRGKLRIFVSGAPGAGRRTFAAIVCEQLGLPLLCLHTDRVPENSWPQVYMRAQRQAFLSGAAIAWYGQDQAARYWPAHAAPYHLQFVIGEDDDFVTPAEGISDLRIQIPVISAEERLHLWKQWVPATSGWKKKALEEISLRYQTTIGQLVAIGQKGIARVEQAYEALRADAAHRLGKLAQQINSDFVWEDLVVPPQVKKSIEDFSFEATERVHLWEEPAAKRLFPQGKGLVALFTGPPGTGKTMAAQVIAASLKLDLFRVDLSTVVSKYIGESSKNIERILSRARTMNTVLFFDEADALFGKRTEVKDAHDRYANADTNYLLQAIEAYDGIVILASNKKANIDPAFTRRLRFIIDFSKPDAAQRLEIWRRILTELAGATTTAAVDKDLIRLADMMELSGAQIKLAVLSALFIARRQKTAIGIQQLLQGLERELLKEGRGLGKQIHQVFK